MVTVMVWMGSSATNSTVISSSTMAMEGSPTLLDLIETGERVALTPSITKPDVLGTPLRVSTASLPGVSLMVPPLRAMAPTISMPSESRSPSVTV